MNRHTSFEVKAASLILGILILWVSLLIGLAGSRDALHYILAPSGMDDAYGVMLFCFGFMVIYGSLKPKRKCRHIGLALAGMSLAGVFGEVLKAGWLTMSTGLVFVLVGACLLVLLVDVSLGAGERQSC